jgi:hypothetical protein
MCGKIRAEKKASGAVIKLHGRVSPRVIRPQRNAIMLKLHAGRPSLASTA